MTTEKEFQGRVGSIDMEKRILSMKDAEDVVHPFKWTEPLDIIMRKWRPGYYLTVKYDEESRTLKNATYWQEGKDVMPKKPSGGRPFQPRNEKPIIYQVCYKEACETARHVSMICQTAIEDQDYMSLYNRLMDMALERAKKDAKVLIQEAGAQ